MDKKSPDAFRTISEVADWLGVPTHVLRFWESRFTQVKPVKRAGGRRYYRPADMELLGGIRKLLHEDGLTIRGVQKLLREQGVKHVATLSPPLDSNEMRTSDGSNVVPLTPPPNAAEEPLQPKPGADEGASSEGVETQADDQNSVDEAPVASADDVPEVAVDDTPPTLTDAVDDGPTEPDLFSAEFVQTSDAGNEIVTELEPAVLEHNDEPTELEADIAESHPDDEIAAPVEEDLVFDMASTQDTPEPEFAHHAETTPEAEVDSVPDTLTAIDISHIAVDVSDDAFASAPNAMISARLRAFRAAEKSLPDDALRSLTARLSDLAARMAPAPSDNGQAE